MALIDITICLNYNVVYRGVLSPLGEILRRPIYVQKVPRFFHPGIRNIVRVFTGRNTELYDVHFNGIDLLNKLNFKCIAGFATRRYIESRYNRGKTECFFFGKCEFHVCEWPIKLPCSGQFSTDTHARCSS